jgi:hypothetical protein
MERVLESLMNSTRHDRIFKILISACKQCLPPLFTFGFWCIYGVWRSDWMVFAVFMGCDVLIGWFLLYLWGVMFWLDGFRCIYGVWHSDWIIRTSHPINTANNWTILECENGTRTRKFYEQYETWSNIQNPYFCM